MILQYLFFVKNKGSKPVVYAWVGEANTTPILAAYFAKRNTKNFGGEKRSDESEGGRKGRGLGEGIFARPSGKVF